MLLKSQIFSFVLSFVATLIAGFFVWNIFINSDNPKIFTASLPSDSEVININPTADSDQNNTASQDLAPDDNSADSAYVKATMAEQEMQDLLDDIQEKLDIISQQVQELIAEQNHPVIRPDAPSDDGAKLDDNQNNDQNINDKTENTSETAVCTGQININTASAEDLDKIIYVGPATAQKIIEARPFYSLNDLLKVSGIGQTTLQKIIEQGCAYVESLLSGGGGGGGGGSTPVVYPKILISEVQILPIAQRFVELYNPNNTDVDLTGWYLQRKDANDISWNSLVSSTNFQNKIIPAGGYFLISRELTNSDILLSITLSPDNSLALKDPNGEIIDQTSFGDIGDGKSTCIADFSASSWELCTPTPKTQNVTCTIDVEEAVDTTPPVGTIIINDGALYANSRNVVLTISATDDSSGVIEMKIANASSYHDWEPYATSESWVLPATNGLKTVRIKFKDAAGNETATGIPATITLDTVAPVIALNGDATVNLAVGDSYQELGAAVTDNIDGSDEVTIGGDTVDTLTPATFRITYDAVDMAGNHATQVVRTVIVSN